MSAQVDERRQMILAAVIRDDEVDVKQLASTLGVSSATVRRDLRQLQERGLIQRTHGGAAPISQSFYGAFPLDSSYQEQLREHAREKRRIAVSAAGLVQDGDVVALTPGTTTAQVARSIVGKQGVTIITTSINVAMELSNRRDLSIFVPGGFLRPNWFSLIGASTVRDIEQFYPDIVYIGVNGIHHTRGLTTQVIEEAAVNRAMIDHGRRRVVVADGSKLGKVYQAKISEISSVNVLITDTSVSDDRIAPYEDIGIEVHRV